MTDIQEAIFQKLIDDPDFYPNEKDREDAAWQEAGQQARQLENTRKALSLAKLTFLKAMTPNTRLTVGDSQDSVAGSKITPIQLAIQEMDFDQLEDVRKTCEQSAKDWEKRKVLRLALAYRRKMYDIDEEIDRRAQEELRKLQERFNGT